MRGVARGLEIRGGVIRQKRYACHLCRVDRTLRRDEEDEQTGFRVLAGQTIKDFRFLGTIDDALHHYERVHGAAMAREYFGADYEAYCAERANLRGTD